MSITLDGTNGITTPDLESTGQVTSNGIATSLYPLVSATAQASTSGTSIDFTSIPSWVKRITVMFNGVSTNGTSSILVQLGDSGGIEATGYVSYCVNTTTSALGSTPYTTGFGVRHDTASFLLGGAMTISDVSGNSWVSTHAFCANTTNGYFGSGSKTLSGTIDRVRITTLNGTDAFDAGSINIMYE